MFNKRLEENLILEKEIEFKCSKTGGKKTYITIKVTKRDVEEYRPDCKFLNYDTLDVVEGEYLYLTMHGKTRKNGTSCQIIDEFEERIPYYSKANQEIAYRLLDIWKEYHLNDGLCGTKTQKDFIKMHAQSKSYEEQCSILKENNLLHDRGHKYGCGWLYKEIPNEVLDFLKSL